MKLKSHQTGAAVNGNRSRGMRFRLGVLPDRNSAGSTGPAQKPRKTTGTRLIEPDFRQVWTFQRMLH
jgi:hypothetical protein